GTGATGGGSGSPPNSPPLSGRHGVQAHDPAAPQTGGGSGLASQPALDLPVQPPPTTSAPEGPAAQPTHPGTHAGFGPHDYTLPGWAAAFLRQLDLAGRSAAVLGGASLLSTTAAASPDAAHAVGEPGSTPSSGSLPASGGAAGSAAAGIASSALFALLVSFTAFALWHLARLLLTPARWRPQAFVAVLERPG
ncbi:MAG TPA: hypothetical protein VFY52_08035, partial [Thermoleophilaceae bacterium]|nr:hypothetical protein [Thermoleophilaceae bacterium]